MPDTNTNQITYKSILNLAVKNLNDIQESLATLKALDGRTSVSNITIGNLSKDNSGVVTGVVAPSIMKNYIDSLVIYKGGETISGRTITDSTSWTTDGGNKVLKDDTITAGTLVNDSEAGTVTIPYEIKLAAGYYPAITKTFDVQFTGSTTPAKIDAASFSITGIDDPITFSDNTLKAVQAADTTAFTVTLKAIPTLSVSQSGYVSSGGLTAKDNSNTDITASQTYNFYISNANVNTVIDNDSAIAFTPSINAEDDDTTIDTNNFTFNEVDDADDYETIKLSTAASSSSRTVTVSGSAGWTDVIQSSKIISASMNSSSATLSIKKAEISTTGTFNATTQTGSLQTYTPNNIESNLLLTNGVVVADSIESTDVYANNSYKNVSNFYFPVKFSNTLNAPTITVSAKSGYFTENTKKELSVSTNNITTTATEKYIKIAKGSIGTSNNQRGINYETYCGSAFTGVPTSGYLTLSAGYYPELSLSLDEILGGSGDATNITTTSDLRFGIVAYDVDGNRVVGSAANATLSDKYYTTDGNTAHEAASIINADTFNTATNYIKSGILNTSTTSDGSILYFSAGYDVIKTSGWIDSSETRKLNNIRVEQDKTLNVETQYETNNNKIARVNVSTNINSIINITSDNKDIASVTNKEVTVGTTKVTDTNGVLKTDTLTSSDVTISTGTLSATISDQTSIKTTTANTGVEFTVTPTLTNGTVTLNNNISGWVEAAASTSLGSITASSTGVGFKISEITVASGKELKITNNGTITELIGGAATASTVMLASGLTNVNKLTGTLTLNTFEGDSAKLILKNSTTNILEVDKSRIVKIGSTIVTNANCSLITSDVSINRTNASAQISEYTYNSTDSDYTTVASIFESAAPSSTNKDNYYAISFNDKITLNCGNDGWVSAATINAKEQPISSTKYLKKVNSSEFVKTSNHALGRNIETGTLSSGINFTDLSTEIKNYDENSDIGKSIKIEGKLTNISDVEANKAYIYVTSTATADDNIINNQNISISLGELKGYINENNLTATDTINFTVSGKSTNSVTAIEVNTSTITRAVNTTATTFVTQENSGSNVVSPEANKSYIIGKVGIGYVSAEQTFSIPDNGTGSEVDDYLANVYARLNGYSYTDIQSDNGVYTCTSVVSGQ